MEGTGGRVGGAEGVVNRVDDPAELGVVFENPDVAVCGLKEEVLCVVCTNAVGSPRLGEGVIPKYELEDLTLSGGLLGDGAKRDSDGGICDEAAGLVWSNPVDTTEGMLFAVFWDDIDGDGEGVCCTNGEGVCWTNGEDVCSTNGEDVCWTNGEDVCWTNGEDVCWTNGEDVCWTNGEDVCWTNGEDVCWTNGEDVCWTNV
ncbi:hypothetical protein EMCRGX_G021135 [Ephydatia muelleri]